MKALAKERTRRYERANRLAADIQRHLADAPVSASPPATRYRIQKFVKRNRLAVVAAVAIATVRLLGVIGTTAGMLWALDAQKSESIAKQLAHAKRIEAEEQRARAQDGERLAAQAAQRAIEQAERAERELARATEIKRLITEMLRSASPEEAKGADATLLKGIPVEELRDPEQALIYAERACTLAAAKEAPNLFRYLNTLAAAQHATRDTTAAINTQKRALELKPEMPELMASLEEYEAANRGTDASAAENE